MYKTLLGVASALIFSQYAFSQAPAGAPAGATGVCRDGTYWTSPTKRGACHGHKGVQTWYAGSSGSASPPAAPAAPAPSAPSSGAAAPSAPSSGAANPPPAPSAAPGARATQPSASAAPGGGPGMVWVNSASHVYHCPSDRWYGKTKQGAYMSEADAVAKGDRPDHGKSCK